MNNPFSQSKVTYRLTLTTYYVFLEKLEEVINELFQDVLLAISTTELESGTIDSQDKDIWQLDAYLSQKPDMVFIHSQILKTAQNRSILLIGQVNLEKILDQDWVGLYQASLKPIEIGEFFISSKIHTNLKPVDKKGIFIEASRAFGTGDHATTSGCIEALLRLRNNEFKKIIDIGTGTGILSFVAKYLWDRAEILACDIEDVAVNIARENADFNNLNIEIYRNTADEVLNDHFRDVKFDLIISNILANPLIELSNQIGNFANNNAYIVLAGFLDNQAQEVITSFEKNGFKLRNTIFKGSWTILTMVQVKEN